MSKKSQKCIKRIISVKKPSPQYIDVGVNSVKTREQSVLNVLSNPTLGKRWTALRAAYSCETDEDFITKLLDLAQGHIDSGAHIETLENEISQKENKVQDIHKNNHKQKKVKKEKNERKLNKFPLNEDIINGVCVSNAVDGLVNVIKDEDITEQVVDVSTLNNKNTEISFSTYPILEASLTKSAGNEVTNSEVTNSEKHEAKNTKKKKSVPNLTGKSVPKDKSVVGKRDNIECDIRKAPKLESQMENLDVKLEKNDQDKTGISIKVCSSCSTLHSQDRCPVFYPHYIVNDSLSLHEWEEKYKTISENIKSESVKTEKEHDNITSDEERDKYTFCKLSMPNIVYLAHTNTSHGAGVFAKDDLAEFTEFGPLIGKTIKEVDISEDSNLRDIWELCLENGNVYISTEDLDVSNWLRFMRPAPAREDRNVIAIIKQNSLYFVTIRQIKGEEELLFWQDTPLNTGKKRLEKTSCGGCNMTFTHPMYYRTHCSVFHDLRYSLTIRKYHCKVCGAAVLGKENIMKHAAELHNGQGAYQCQFCKKFFLRLNYLEMHRTYGCSANPHRSRPLCDFCGRKFCQPQKLKVHIKRMHSDFSEVLKEFQCKSCLKILGSRAALQRHAKEVHQKQVDSTCSCVKCGKHFQNKSNLKIHMLTHSGIKPFKCAVNNCNAAFTTKQCLQFHYKKVHNLTEDAMPKIERSVDYTFEAYSGLEDGDNTGDGKSNMQTDSTAATFDEGSDFDENSVDSKSMDDPPGVQSPLELSNEHSPKPEQTTNDNYNISSLGTNMKILSKGSKKWIGDEPVQNQTLRSDIYHLDQNLRNKEDMQNLSLPAVTDTHLYDRTKLNTNLNTFGRHESSNASLLVEAALDSVCSEPNIDIDVSSTPNCTETLVNNLYTLAPNDSLGDVSYSESVCINESRDINLISPSVNDHISVTDELNDELRQNQTIGMDYSTFHHEEFSPANSPGIPQRHNFVRNYINSLSPNNQNYSNQPKVMSPVPSPPRYDFGHAVNPDHLSSDDSNGIGAQNLSLHSSKNDLQLDLSIYKSYKLDPPTFQPRKDFRIRFDTDSDRKQTYLLDTENMKDYDNPVEQSHVDSINQNDLATNIQNDVLNGDKDTEETERPKYPDDLSNDLRHKFDLDLDLRIKNYDVEADVSRTKSTYESQSDLDFRSKNYDLIDSIENRSKPYESTLDTDFRSDRSFEPLMLNSSELQGLDMSARSFHNYPNINRYHHLYPDVDRVDLRLNYSPPPPSYAHPELLRVVSLDLTSPGRHSVDLSLRSHPLHQLTNSRLLTDHRLLSTDLTAARHLGGESRLLSETSGRILSDHTTNRILSTADQLTTNHLLTSEQTRLLSEDSRLISDQTRLLDQTRLIGDGRMLPPTTPSGTVSPVPTFTGYTVAQSPYHPTPLAPRPHVTSPAPTPYHHYSPYY